MSRHNRSRTGNQQRATGEPRASTPGWGRDPGPPGQATIEAALLRAAHLDPGSAGRAAEDLAGRFGSATREFELACDAVLASAVRGAWQLGWMPCDLREFGRRHLEPPMAQLIAMGIVFESRRYARATVHPRWQAAVDEIEARVGPDATQAALLHGLEVHTGRSRRSALVVLLQVLGELAALPPFEQLLPLPGRERHAESAGSAVDGKVLAKVRALLAKAESTDFPDEAEALSAKAQELMSRYSLHQAVHEHYDGRAPAASGRRLWLDPPYQGAKVLLVQAVATANRCQVAWRSGFGVVTVIGPETELDIVELLTTSLLLQAGRAMLAAGRQIGRDGTSRTRSFRHSFLVAYADRIGERLQAADTTATAELPDVPREQLLPVLAARSRATDELMARLFPRMASRRVSVSNSAGWTAGRAAADLARLDVRRSIAG